MVRWVCVRPCLLLHPGLEIPGATAAVILTRVADSNLTHPLGWPSGNRRGPMVWGEMALEIRVSQRARQRDTRDR